MDKVKRISINFVKKGTEVEFHNVSIADIINGISDIVVNVVDLAADSFKEDRGIEMSPAQRAVALGKILGKLTYETGAIAMAKDIANEYKHSDDSPIDIESTVAKFSEEYPSAYRTYIGLMNYTGFTSSNDGGENV